MSASPDGAYPRYKAALFSSSMWWKYGCGLIITYVVYGAFFIAGGAAKFGSGGDNARVIFFHVPSAILSSICYFVGMYYAAMYLWLPSRGKVSKSSRESLIVDAKSGAAMELGFLFCLLATVTGSIFAGIQWGSFWNWDPRETSIVIMLLLYAGYLVLRGATAESKHKRARLSAVYAIVALVPSQYLIWAVPRLVATNHPTTTLVDPSMTSLNYKLVLYPAIIGFIALFTWMFQLRVRAVALTLAREELS